jgi:hypothetical protein
MGSKKLADPGAAAAQRETIEVGADAVAPAHGVAAGAELGEHRRAGLPALHHIARLVVDGLGGAFPQGYLARRIQGRGAPTRRPTKGHPRGLEGLPAVLQSGDPGPDRQPGANRCHRRPI